jgi:cytochrome b pre-mRNA-processing protein 3
MIFPLFRRGPRGPDTISTLYGMIVAQARFPVFYRDYAVPDTVNGRFDMIVLHLAVVLDRLTQDPRVAASWSGNFRSVLPGSGPQSAGNGRCRPEGGEMQRVGETFYGRAQAYRVALEAAAEGPLVAALERNIYGGPQAAAAAAPRLAAYVRGGGT